MARLSLPKGNVYLRMRDELGVWCHDGDFANLFSLAASRRKPVATRIDWKYVLGLELTAPSFDYSILSEFRDRLLHGQAEQRLLEAMLRRFRELGLLRGRGRQRSDSTHVLAAVRLLNRLELVGETLRHGLEVLAEAAPAWWSRLRRLVRPLQPSLRAVPFAQGQAAAGAGGKDRADGYHLLGAVYATGAPVLRQLPAVPVLRRVWLQQYYREDGRIDACGG